MITVTDYRIHPSWFGGEDDANVLIKELAEGSAARMGWLVTDVKITGQGADRGGQYIDFRVTYSTHNAIVEYLR